MSRPPDDLLREWGRAVLPVEDADVADERRARIVGRIATSIRETASERTRSSRRTRIWFSLVAAMLLLVTGVLAFASRNRPPSITSKSGAAIDAARDAIANATPRAVPAMAETNDKPTNPNPPAEAPAPTPSETKRAAAREKSPPLAATDLAEQNRLFAAARAATQRGDDRGAIAKLDQLLSRFPGSPLAPEARVERFRALKRVGDRAGAAREARRYLLEQKDGPARQEARDLALDPDQSRH